MPTVDNQKYIAMKTQKKLAAVMFILLIAGAVSAQDISNSDGRNTLQIGIKAGINNSDLYDTKGQNFVANSLWGPVFGGFLSIPIGTYLGVQPEVLYSAKGYSGTGVTSGPEILGGGQPYSYEDRTDYLDVPIMLQFKPIPNLYILGGPEYSYLLSTTYTYTKGVTSESTQQQFNNDNIRHNIFGVIFGADLGLTRNLVLGGRIAWDLQDNNGDGTSSLPRYRNYWGQLTLGYKF